MVRSEDEARGEEVNDRIHLTRPWTGDAERGAVARVLDSGWLTQGPEVARFEQGLAERVGCAHALTASSGTAALELALLALHLPPDSEVIMPGFTFPATAHAALLHGLVPVPVDIDPETFNMAPEAAAEAIGPRTSAIMPVHQFGLMADLDAIGALADQHDLAMVEDAACALGATSPAGAAGAVGRAGCFSFHPRKTITTGEGGAVTTSDEDVAAGVRSQRNHGMQPGPHGVTFHEPGYNLRMPDLLAAIGNCQLDRLDACLEGRRTRAARYAAALDGVDWLAPPMEPEGYGHTWQTYAVLLDAAVDRQALMTRLLERGIENSIGAHALNRIGYLEPYCEGRSFDGCERAADAALCLPLYPTMTDDDVDRVVEVLKACGP
jgi:perosamine synthetase